jgi:chemotaxis protein MotA
MKFGTAIGILIAMFGLGAGAFLEGTNPMVVLNVPALLIVLLGTLGATIAATGLEATLKVPKLYMKAIKPDEHDLVARVDEIVGYAEKARRDGLLALDEAVNTIADPFTRKGLQLVVDGTDPDLVAAVLDAENEAMRKRHVSGRSPFMQAGALSPTMAIVGTVFGLVNVMNNLNQPENLGHLIAAALLATLIGVGAANVIFLPVGNRLKELSEVEMHFREMTLEGILAIQAGDNPRVVAEKLIAYVPPGQRPSEDQAATGSGSAPQQQAA